MTSATSCVGGVADQLAAGGRHDSCRPWPLDFFLAMTGPARCAPSLLPPAQRLFRLRARRSLSRPRRFLAQGVYTCRNGTFGRTLPFVVVTLFCVASVHAQATNSDPAGTQSSRHEKSANESNAFLGVAVEALPPSLAAQLHEQLPNEELLVGEVSEDSPAAKAGIKRYDILTTCDDQKLTSPQQLINLIRAKKPGDKVSDRVSSARGRARHSDRQRLGEVPASEQGGQRRAGTPRAPRARRNESHAKRRGTTAATGCASALLGPVAGRWPGPARTAHANWERLEIAQHREDGQRPVQGGHRLPQRQGRGRAPRSSREAVEERCKRTFTM